MTGDDRLLIAFTVTCATTLGLALISVDGGITFGLVALIMWLFIIAGRAM